MKSGTPSRTSEGATAVRPREVGRPPADRICHDPYAEFFLGPFYQALRKYQLLGKSYGWLREWLCPGLRGGILARARYIDERLATSLRDGIEQLCKKMRFHGVNRSMEVSEMFRFVHAKHL